MSEAIHAKYSKVIKYILNKNEKENSSFGRKAECRKINAI